MQLWPLCADSVTVISIQKRTDWTTGTDYVASLLNVVINVTYCSLQVNDTPLSHPEEQDILYNKECETPRAKTHHLCIYILQ